MAIKLQVFIFSHSSQEYLPVFVDSLLSLKKRFEVNAEGNCHADWGANEVGDLHLLAVALNLPESIVKSTLSSCAATISCENAMNPSTEYWGEFETHLTISPFQGQSKFRTWCEQHQLKCVEIELARGTSVHQPMASWLHTQPTNLSDVLNYGERMAKSANKAGFKVTRLKVEAAPSNQDVPSSADEARSHSPNNYFEHHIKVRRDSQLGIELLTKVSQLAGAHLSRNARRKCEDGFEERFVTLRNYGLGRNDSNLELRQLVQKLHEINEQIVEIESEYCVFDSNVALDDGWL